MIFSSNAPGMSVVGEASTAADAIRRIPAARPDVAILDARLPDGSGIDVCREIRSKSPDTRCLILTSYDDDDALFAAVMAGAAGYLLKEIGGSSLTDAIRAVAAGKSLLDPAVTGRLPERLRHPPGHPPAVEQPDRAGTGNPGSDRCRRLKPGNRPATVSRREDCQELRLFYSRQAQHATPYPGSRLRRRGSQVQAVQETELRAVGPGTCAPPHVPFRRVSRQIRRPAG